MIDNYIIVGFVIGMGIGFITGVFVGWYVYGRN